MDATLDEVRRMYNGYRFHPSGPSVFNPFSTLNLLRTCESPRFLVPDRHSHLPGGVAQAGR
ncbi:MAG: AAA family ATPase [Fibrobacteres bacterium]|nr:AAA family ATPase [Fibrobacterota bacterium]